MEFTATAKYIRISPRKLRLVTDGIKQLMPKNAIAQLGALPNHAGIPLAKVIESAMAQAKDKQGNTETLRFRAIEVMIGTSMKRFRAVSKGQAHTYKKRMSHIRVVLTDESPTNKQISK